jgi:hypothetical protein
MHINMFVQLLPTHFTDSMVVTVRRLLFALEVTLQAMRVLLELLLLHFILHDSFIQSAVSSANHRIELCRTAFLQFAEKETFA